MNNIKQVLIFSALVLVSASALAQRNSEGGERGGRGGPPEFSMVDLDGDGVLTLEEFMSEDIPHGDHTEIYGFIDSDADGQVTEDEWTNHKPPRRSGGGSRQFELSSRYYAKFAHVFVGFFYLKKNVGRR